MRPADAPGALTGPADVRVAVRAAVRAHWGVDGAVVRRLPGGMNSRTWSVTSPGDRPVRRWVAKLVGAENRDGFRLGLAAAVRVEAAGVPAGVPEPTDDGRSSIEVAGGELALLRWVDGRPLTGRSDEERRLVGATLAAAHLTLGGIGGAEVRRFPAWVDAGAAHLDVEAWVGPAVRDALAGFRRLAADGLTCGVLHGDPAPEAFRWSRHERRVGLIDWSSAVPGPLLYDLASAVMYVGGPTHAKPLLDSYASRGALPSAEVAGGLGTLLRLRWAVQADYFARRLAHDDRTGLTDPAGNVTGLHDARDFFGA